MGKGPVTFVDTTLRDGQMSLWDTQLPTSDMVAVAPHLERAGYVGVEIIASGFFKKCVRDLREDPWERLRAVKQLLPTVPLRAIHNRYPGAFQLAPPVVYELWAERLYANGVSEVRMSDPSNTPSVWERNSQAAADAGLKTILNLTFSVSPKHSDHYYAQRARHAADLPVAAICLKDPGGLLTPERLRTLLHAIQQEAGAVPVAFHGHCNNGLGPLNCLEAIGLGVRIIDTALPPLANGPSNPSVLNVVRNAEARGYDVAIDLEPLQRATEHLEAVRARRGWPKGTPAEFDESYYEHQVPGGMRGSLSAQLGKTGMGARLDEVLEEIVRVRSDLGYPIMVTPYSQFVGAQATVNVLTGERYSVVLDEVLQYALGLWGTEEMESIVPEVRDRLVDRPRAQALLDSLPADLTRAEFKDRYGGVGVSDDEALLRYFAGDEASRVRTGPAEVERLAGGQAGVLDLVERVGRLATVTYLHLERDSVRLKVQRGARTPEVDD